jgi:cytochrome c oxidase assembly factor CtaG
LTVARRAATLRWIMSTDHWLARLAFSFFIVAALLVWEIYKTLDGQRGPVPSWRIGLYMIATVFAIVMGALGVRARHRLLRDESQPDDGHDRIGR